MDASLEHYKPSDGTLEAPEPISEPQITRFGVDVDRPPWWWGAQIIEKPKNTRIPQESEREIPPTNLSIKQKTKAFQHVREAFGSGSHPIFIKIFFPGSYRADTTFSLTAGPRLGGEAVWTISCRIIEKSQNSRILRESEREVIPTNVSVKLKTKAPQHIGEGFGSGFPSLLKNNNFPRSYRTVEFEMTPGSWWIEIIRNFEIFEDRKSWYRKSSFSQRPRHERGISCKTSYNS